VLHHRVAVGRRRHEIGNRRAAAAARLVDDLEVDAHRGFDGSGHGPAELVGAAARAIGDDQGDRPFGKAIGLGDVLGTRQGGPEEQTDRQSNGQDSETTRHCNASPSILFRMCRCNADTLPQSERKG
jgi:hypothetical protein